MPTLEFNHEKMYTYLKGYAAALGWNDVLNALAFARKAHGGQSRKDGQPYIVHPLTMACHALALGIKDQVVVAGCLLHDVCEDCGVKPEDLPVSDGVKDVVRRLTHIKGVPDDVYYGEVGGRWESALDKILDRCHNVSSMAGVFTPEKCAGYIQEAEDWVMPLFRKIKDEKPEYGDVLFVLKYHILSVDKSLAALLEGIGDDSAPKKGA